MAEPLTAKDETTGDEVINTATGLPDRNFDCGCEAEGSLWTFDGVVSVKSTDLGSDCFGVDWGLRRQWGSGAGYTDGVSSGSGTVIAELPYLREDEDGTIAVISGGSTARLFDLVSSDYVGRSMAETFTLTDTTGSQLVFFDFDAGCPLPSVASSTASETPTATSSRSPAATAMASPQRCNAASPSTASRPSNPSCTPT